MKLWVCIGLVLCTFLLSRPGLSTESPWSRFESSRGVALSITSGQRLGPVEFDELYSQSLYQLRGAEENIWQYSSFDGDFSSRVFGWCAESCEGLQVVTLERVGPDGAADGRPFSLYEVTAAPLFLAGDDQPITVKGYRDDESAVTPVVTQDLALAPTPGMAMTYTLTGFTGLTRITFEKADPSGQFYDAALTGLVFCAPGTDADEDQVCNAEDDFPNDPGENTDTDEDGLGDNAEQSLGTEFDNPDTDGDDYSDGDEVDAGTDPLDPDDYPLTGLSIILLKAAIDAQANP